MAKKIIEKAFSDKSEAKSINEIIDNCNSKAKLFEIGFIEVDPNSANFIISQKGLKIYEEFISELKEKISDLFFQDLFSFLAEKHGINLLDNELQNFIYFAKKYETNKVESEKKDGI